MASRLGKEKLTIKQRALVKGLAQGKTVTRAALDAGYSGSPATARVEAHRTLQKPHIQEALEKALDLAGASLEKSARVIADAHEANKIQSIGFKAHTMPDHKIRLSAAELNCRIRKVIGPKQEDGEGGGVAAILLLVRQSSESRGLPL